MAKTAPQKTVLLTGGLGFLGRAIIDHAPANIRLIITDRPPANSIPTLAHNYAKLDVLDFDETLFNGVDTVIHNAGVFDLTAPSEVLNSVNILGSRKVAEAAINQGVKHVIQVSSTSVYGQHTIPIAEGVEPKKPVHTYGRSKWLGEVASRQVCETADVAWSAVRPTLVYGPRSRYGLAPFIAMLHQLGKSVDRLPLPTGGPEVHTVHVTDVARAVWHLSTHQHTGVFNVSDRSPLSFGQLLKDIANALNLRTRAIPLPWRIVKPVLRPTFVRPILKRLERMVAAQRVSDGSDVALDIRLDEDWCYFLTSDYVFSNQRLRDSGFEFAYPETAEGLKETVEWYIDKHWL